MIALFLAIHGPLDLRI